MNTYKDKSMYVIEVSPSDARLISWVLQEFNFEDSNLHDRADTMGNQIQSLLKGEGDCSS